MFYPDNCSYLLTILTASSIIPPQTEIYAQRVDISYLNWITTPRSPLPRTSQSTASHLREFSRGAFLSPPHARTLPSSHGRTGPSRGIVSDKRPRVGGSGNILAGQAHQFYTPLLVGRRYCDWAAHFCPRRRPPHHVYQPCYVHPKSEVSRYVVVANGVG